MVLQERVRVKTRVVIEMVLVEVMVLQVNKQVDQLVRIHEHKVVKHMVMCKLFHLQEVLLAVEVD